MATIDTITTRPASGMSAGDTYFETSSDKIIVWTGSAWTELVSDNAPASFSNAYSLYFDGTGDLATCGDISAINSASNVTISCWVKADSFPNSTFNSIWGGGPAGGAGHPKRFWFSLPLVD